MSPYYLLLSFFIATLPAMYYSNFIDEIRKTEVMKKRQVLKGGAFCVLILRPVT